MTRLLFKNIKYDDLMIPTHTGSRKIFRNQIVEGDAYLPLAKESFLVPITEEDAKEQEIRYTFYTQKYLLRR